MPQHSHSFASGSTAAFQGQWNPTSSGTVGGIMIAKYTNDGASVSVSGFSFTLSGSVGNAGQATPTAMENRPPYYALCYIMRVA
jgi:microcystin-dependent protein